MMVIVTYLLLRINDRVVMVLILVNDLLIIHDPFHIVRDIFWSQNNNLIAILMVRDLLLSGILLLSDLFLLLMLSLSLML
jgi:hypothetical protein